MNLSHAGLLAQTVSTTKYALLRTESLGMWWHWLLLLGVCAAVVLFVIYMYIRDARELPAAVAVALAGLRVFAFAGLLLTFMHLEKSTQRKVQQDSKVIVLVDASQSMGLEDQDDSSSAPNSTAGRRRIDLVASELAHGEMLTDLRRKHEVEVMRFDESEQPLTLASYEKLRKSEDGDATPDATTASDLLPHQLTAARWLFGLAAVLIGLAIPAILTYIFSSHGAGTATSLALLAGVVLLAGGAVLAAITNLMYEDISFAAVLGTEDIQSLRGRLEQQDSEAATQRKSLPDPQIDWQQQLTPAGGETRLGDALTAVINRSRGQPVAGIVVISDGQSNAGLPYTDAVSLAKEADVPIYTIGIGSDRRPTNAAVVDVEAPARVYPGDAFTVTGFVQAFGMDGRPAKVELVSYPQTKGEEAPQMRYEDERHIRLGAGGELVPVKFDVEPDELPGRRVYQIRLAAPRGDRNGADNAREAIVQHVDRTTRVLLLAGGPTREFRFLRNLLFRDKEITVDVFLQTGRPGISQEADNLLYAFPEDADELFQYDAIVAFDPDWEDIDEAQIRLLEEWVDRQAGGLIVVAGPVHTSKLAGARRADLSVDLLKGLYPVVFSSLGSSIELGRFQADEPSPVEFTRDGLEAEFLWLGENAAESRHAWSGFEGVYGYFAVKDVKPGATVYARFINEAEAVGGEMPVYMAGQYYGAGRVFFLASGEMWRLRALDESYFETFYTKLIRHAAEGRLLRDSERGVLMVERPRYKVGDVVNIQARLSDAQHRPLSAEKLATVDADVTRPDGVVKPVTLRNVNLGGGEMAGREGMYAGQFTALQLGDYRVNLKVPESNGTEELSQQFSVRAPRKEIERPERNDVLLVDLAQSTRGLFFNGMHVASGAGEVASLAAQIEPRDRRTPLPDLPDKRFERQLMWWLLSLIAGALCLEWLIRRVSKLA